MDRDERFERGLPPMGEDLIDFPCAPCWVQHYADQGMTRAYPEGFNPDSVYHPWRYRTEQTEREVVHKVHFVELEPEHEGGVDV